MNHPFVAAALVSLALSAAAQDVEQASKIENDLSKAKGEIGKKYGDRKLEELSLEERRARAREETEAANKVYEKHGTDAKAFERGRQRMSQESQREVRAKAEAIRKKEEEGAKKSVDKPPEVVIERGFKNAEEFDAREGVPEVEKSSPSPPRAPRKRRR